MNDDFARFTISCDRPLPGGDRLGLKPEPGGQAIQRRSQIVSS